jgi:hypothetical protein
VFSGSQVLSPESVPTAGGNICWSPTFVRDRVATATFRWRLHGTFYKSLN